MFTPGSYCKKQAIKLEIETIGNNFPSRDCVNFVLFCGSPDYSVGIEIFTGFPRLGPVSSRRRRLVALMLMMAAIYVWSHTVQNRTNRGKASYFHS
jgi:hypothetical protein